MPSIITVISQKGGSGKTTLALNLSVAALEAGKRVLLLDIDPQASATAWYRLRADKSLLVQPTHPAGLPEMRKLAEEQGVDWIVIDTAAQTDSNAAAAVEVSDLALITCRPSVMDLRAIPNSVRLCKMRDIVPHVVLTQIEAQGSLATEARKNLDALGVDVLPGGLGRRAAFHHSLIDGRAACEFEPSGKAANEVRALYRSVCHLVDKSSKHLDDKPARRQTPRKSPKR